MPFYRFERLRSYRFNPHLSSAEGPVIEGEYLYFRLVSKRAGTGAELHYHPNELMAFPLAGRANVVVGKDRRIVGPGTLVHFPPYARHGLKATEDADLRYLYVKDRTWTLIGTAADEPLPERAPSATEVARALAQGRNPGREKDPARSRALVEGLGECYYVLIERLDAPAASAHCERWVEGRHLAFGFVEAQPGRELATGRALHELFVYVIAGALEAGVASENRLARAGDVIHVPRGTRFQLRVPRRAPARYCAARSTETLEAAIRCHGAADNWRG